MVTPDYFSERGWWTPNQIRDYLLFYPIPTTEQVQAYKVMAINEQARRKALKELYVECPRCKGYHEQLNNIDKLCEICEQFTAPSRYDSKLKTQ
jgi:hypothetical protein